MEDINLKIHNYTSNEQQKKVIQSKMVGLLRQIPYDSHVLLDFNYQNKIFYGKLKVECIGKTFFSSDKNTLLSSLTVSLCKKIQKQVMKWKESRTVEEITGIISLNPDKISQGSSFYSHKKAS